MTIDLAKLLHRKYQESKLGHFYLVKASSTTESQHLVDWSKSFLKNILKAEKNLGDEASERALNGHPDVYIVSETQNRKLDTEKLEGLSKFLEFKPYELKNKFVIVERADLLTKTWSNKLLKALEEPVGKTCFLFLSPSPAPLLDTIESRAINLTFWQKDDNNLSAEEKIQTKLELTKWLQKKKEIREDLELESFFDYIDDKTSASAFCDQLKGKKKELYEIIRIMSEGTLLMPSTYQEIDSHMKQLELFIEAQAYNNSPNQSLLSLSHQFKEQIGKLA